MKHFLLTFTHTCLFLSVSSFAQSSASPTILAIPIDTNHASSANIPAGAAAGSAAAGKMALV